MIRNFMSFRERLEYLDEVKRKYKMKHPNGTYVCAQLSPKNKQELSDWVKEHNIPNPADPDQYHTTITYSRKGIPDVENHKFDSEYQATPLEWKIFPTQSGTKCLVLAVKSDSLDHLHHTIQNTYGAQYDFPDYIPHITVSYDYTGSIPKDLPKLNLKYNKIKVEPLDEDYTSKVD